MRNMPVLQPGSRQHHGVPEVVWSSPVLTGAGAAVPASETTSVSPEQDERRGERYVYAFESDLLDSALVHWDHDQNGLTLEMIPGFKTESVPASDDIYAAESVSSALNEFMTGTLNDAISIVDFSRPQANEKPIQPDTSNGVGGPLKVRSDGIEDPVKGWRPTGMVFFETLSTPPRGTIYSSTLLEEFLRTDAANAAAPAAGFNAGYDSLDAAPFFDFPEVVAPAPPDDTEDFSPEVVVRGGRGGGGGGIWVFRLFGKLLLLSLALLGIGFLVLLASYGNYVKQRLYDDEAAGRNVTVMVKPGDGFRTVIDNMHQAGVLQGFMGLDDRFIMRYLAYAFENSDKIKPGVYRFHTGQNLQDAYDKLIAGSKDFKLTIAEGKTAREVAEQVASNYKNFDPNRFVQLVNDPEYARKLNVDAPSLEGYLYPSTYYFGPGMTEEELIQLMVSTFQGKVEDAQDKLTTGSGLSFHQHVIMASLIEREARMDEDRPYIASVIFNRLEKGIPLQIDATVNFALNNWRRLTHADYTTDHPYNTYKIKGLPPGPIASPRIESLLATFQAPDTDYFYYVHKGDGHHAFAETYAQHQANVGRYIREKNLSGMGNQPSVDAAMAQAASPSKEGEKAPALADDTASEDVKEPEVKEAEKSDASETNVEEADEKEAAGKKAEKADEPEEKSDEDSPVAVPKAKSY